MQRTIDRIKTHLERRRMARWMERELQTASPRLREEYLEAMERAGR